MRSPNNDNNRTDMKSEKVFETLKIEQSGGIKRIMLNRPEKNNALSPKLMRELAVAVGGSAEDDQVRVIVISGQGQAFSAGGDMEEELVPVAKMDFFRWYAYQEETFKFIQAITGTPKPIIAAVNGVAVGGGCDLALMCDIRIASEHAQFGMYYVRMGLVPGLGGSYFLPRLVGVGMAKLLIFTGELIDARRAKEIGLVEIVAPVDNFETAVQELAEKLAAGPTKAIGMSKIAINRSINVDLNTALDYTTYHLFPLFRTLDHQEAVKAFLEGRERPVFMGE